MRARTRVPSAGAAPEVHTTPSATRPLADAVKLTVYVVDLTDFPLLNEILASVLESPYPARATVEVSALPRGARVEIDMVATKG